MTKQELASKVWSMANKMRTKIKANEYKDYILGFMFYKYLSDKELDFLRNEGITPEELQNMDDDDMSYIRDSLGYAISYDNLFSSWKNLGISLNAKTVSEGIDDFNRNVNPSQKMVFDHIFDTLQGGISKMGDSSGSRDKAVRDMVDMVNTIPSDKDSGYDVLGYVYEYLIYKFATAAKDDGAFYTPHEVSRLISLIVADSCKDFKELRVYDPTSGSGSLLRTIGEAASRYIPEKDIKYYGQEKITETYHLTRMNLVMKGVPSQNIIVRNGDTLEDDWPYFDENTAYQPLRVNAVVSNPPYSLNWEPEGRAMDDRFRKYGLAPSGKADYAFLLHCLYHLENDGIMAIVLPHGVLFRGDAEGEIRKNLCLEHNIETIIGLPENLFFATNIPTIIMVLRKNRKADDILFIDASQKYSKGKNQNTLRDCDIKRIFDAVKAREDVPGFAKLVPFDKIKEEEFNLNIPRYVSAAEEAEHFDLAALVNGTVLNNELDEDSALWSVFGGLRENLFTDLGNGYSSFNDVNIKDTVKEDESVKAFAKAFESKVDDFRVFLEDELIKDSYDVNAGEVRDAISDKLFEMISKVPVLDRYDAFQHFMDVWTTIETDMSVIGNDIDVCRQTEPNMVLKKVKQEEIEVQKGYKGTVMPFDLIGETFFNDEYEEVKSIRSEIESLESDKDSIFDSLDDDVKNSVGDGEKFKEADLKKYLKENSDEELARALEDIGKVKVLNKQIKDKESAILDKIKGKIESLTDDEIVECLKKKWIDPICSSLNGMTAQLTGEFIKKIEGLKAKYGTPMSVLKNEQKQVNFAMSELLGELIGSDIDMQAIASIKAIL